MNILPSTIDNFIRDLEREEDHLNNMLSHVDIDDKKILLKNIGLITRSVALLQNILIAIELSHAPAVKTKVKKIKKERKYL